jgi:inorganic pyrophosphatase
MSKQSRPRGRIARLPAYDAKNESYHVVIETPKGSRNKYKYEAKLGLFALSGVLPAGAVFPFDFGFIPGTKGEDGDPLDVLVLLDDSSPMGCLVAARLIGVIQAEQTERDGETVRNDRLIAVAVESRNHQHIRELQQLADSLRQEIEHFFVSFNQVKGKEFKPLGRAGAQQAEALVKQAMPARKKKRK